MRRARRHTSHDLERFADGRVWRLKKGRDFEGTTRAFRGSAQAAAQEIGKVVAVVPDKLQPDRYVWIQFADASIAVGERCVCGSQNLARLHRHWARCDDCGRLLDINDPDVGDDDDGSAAGSRPGSGVSTAGLARPRGTLKGLDAFDDLTLYRHSISDDVEQCFGVGRRPGPVLMLLSVRFPLEDGQRIPDPSTPGQWLHTMSKAPLEGYAALLDGVDLEDGVRVSWRISEDPGPQPHEDFEEPAPG